MRLHILLFTVILGMPADAEEANVSPIEDVKRWSAQRANDWYSRQPWLVGCNFIPSTAINQLEMWQADTFDPETIDRELGWASGLGFNIVRVYLHDLAYDQDPEGFLQRMDRYLQIADAHDIRTMFVFFDDCWLADPKAGKQPVSWPGVHNSGWLESPGLPQLERYAADGTLRRRLEAYVEAVLTRFRSDRRVVMWDLYNEPGGWWYRRGEKPGVFERGLTDALCVPLLRDVYRWAREVDPSQPLTSCWNRGAYEAEAALAWADIITFHHYGNPASLEELIGTLRESAPHRPMICTEYLRRSGDSRFETHLPIFLKRRIGAINWGLVAGKTNTMWDWDSWAHPGSPEPTHWQHDILRDDGTPYDEAETSLIRSLTTQAKRVERDLPAPDFTADVLMDLAETPPRQTHLSASPPPPPVVRRIRGIYPHLAVTSVQNECGIGVVVPWADRLWAVTYAPHKPNGSDDKLYEIDANLAMTIRPESIGGTPANRMIHAESQQLIIGPYFIDTNRTVRTIPYATMPGRHTATVRHLTDPANQVYFFTMEDGVYEVDVHTLSVNTIYPDVQGTGDNHLHGYHGKGAYSGQGYLYVANNGRNWNNGDPTGDAGALARWDGSLPHAWDELFLVQHCELTGPGGIHGNANPVTDPIWATGFDAKSVLLRSIEDGTVHTWRLPKASYSHDGSHGWHTEWPRIREIEPGVRLMHMHGIFFDFPSTFSCGNPSGLSPICNYYKMPVDYCMFNGQLVLAKNDTSKFSNALVKRAQSNLWFGELDDLRSWGAPAGFGAVWMNERVCSAAVSDPFLVNGFDHVALHLRHGSGSDVGLEIQTRTGSGAWTPLRPVTIPASGSTYELLNDHGVEWVRIVMTDATTDLTAVFHVGNPYPHTTTGSRGTDPYAALADIKDSAGYSDGIIRVMDGADLQLELATTGGYARIDDQLELTSVSDGGAEALLRSEGALSREFGFDAASAWVSEGGTVFRLPRLHPGYEEPFLSGWARGFREVVTERQLLNCHGTFYEVPRSNSGGIRKMRPLTTHGKRITDFASWRGLLVLTGVLDSAPESDTVVKTEDGSGALWLGDVDDVWRMGEPRGVGGPWKDTAVTANTPSDPYLMVGYRRKELTLSHLTAGPVAFTVEVDVLADDTWSIYDTFTVNAGETATHVFPEGFAAHWVRLRSDAATTATAQLLYGPIDARDAFLGMGAH